MFNNEFPTAVTSDAAGSSARMLLYQDAVRKPEAKRLVRIDQSPRDVLADLMAADLLGDAIRFLAMALPNRPSILWGALCVWEGYQGNPPVEAAAAIEATCQWLREPSESNRRTVEQRSRVARIESPAGALALAAFMSGGSISQPHLPFVSSGPSATGRLVAGAIMLSAVQRRPFEYCDRYRQYLAMGREVADGQLGWLAAPAEPISLRVDPPQLSTPAPHVCAHPHHFHAEACRAGAEPSSVAALNLTPRPKRKRSRLHKEQSR